jgi:hypothetical protein
MSYIAAMGVWVAPISFPSTGVASSLIGCYGLDIVAMGLKREPVA